MNTTLMQIVVDAIAFFATSYEESVDPDVAVEQLEHISDALRRLTPNERREFLEFVGHAASAARAEGDSGRAQFLAELPENLGLSADS